MQGKLCRFLTTVLGLFVPQQVLGQTPTPSTEWPNPPPSAPAGHPVIGMLILAGIALIVILIIWLVSRAEDIGPN
jgi:hypothetical protein